MIAEAVTDRPAWLATFLARAGRAIKAMARRRHDTADRRRTLIAAGIAHELRTPLTILKGRLHGLEDGVIVPGSDDAARLLRQVDHLLHITEDLGALAQADAGQLTLDRRRLNLDALLRETTADLRSLVAPRGIAFVERYAPAAVLGDPVRLTQIFTNILTNAIKHGPRDRTITIVTECIDGEVVTHILDEGPGFAPRDAAKLFTPFWRAPANRSAGRPGSGLGLTVSARLAEAHGGRITARNRSDRSGACFSVWLPIAGPRAIRATAAFPSPTALVDASWTAPRERRR
jgi:two-component system sensor histidine kinase AdeS